MRIRSVVLLAVGMMFSISSINGQTDQQAQKILNKVSKVYKAYKTMTVGFTVETENTVSKKKTKASGKLWVKGEKFRYHYDGEKVFCNGKTLWTYNEEINEVTIDKFKKKTNGISPSNIFTLYQKGFQSKYDGTKTIGGKSYYVIKLTPKEKKKNKYYLIQMLINKQTSRIKSMKVFYKNGMRITYKINSFKANATISSGYFEFDITKYPGVVEVDLR
jgi:outer membrane lipoprotein carrier protein